MKNLMRIISVVLMITILLSVSFYTASAASNTAGNEYKERIMSLIYEKYDFVPREMWDEYKMIFSYYKPGSMEPDYIIFTVCATKGNKETIEIVDDYVVISTTRSFPYELGYFVYVPSDDSVYTLAQAFEAGVENLGKINNHNRIYAELIGDADADLRITVRDATWIQKVVAGHRMIAKYDDYLYAYIEEIVRDFNRDGGINIKDATDIQKYVAGIEVDIPEYSTKTVPFSDRISEKADFTDDSIIVMTKYGWGYDYTLEDFPEYEFKSIEKIGGRNEPDYAYYVLELENPSRENVIEAVRSLEYRADRDLYAAEPNYIAYAHTVIG